MSVAQFGRRVCDTFAGDDRFGFYFRHVSRLGGPNDSDISIISEHDKKEIEDYLWRSAGLPKPAGESEPYICYAAKGNSLVIRSTGRLAKCTVALTDECNDIGWISEDGEVLIDQTKFRRWIAPLIEAREDELECPLGWVMGEVAKDSAKPFHEHAT